MLRKILVYIFGFLVVLAFITPIETSAATKLRPQPNNTGLVLYYPLDEGTGDVVNDISGEDNHGTIAGYFDDLVWTTGKSGYGFYSFGEYIDVPATTTLSFSGTEAFSVSFWIKTPGDVEGYHIAGDRSGCTGGTFVWQFHFDTATTIGFGNTSGGATSDQIPTNEWVHVVGTYDGSTFRIYTNGVEGTPVSGVSLGSGGNPRFGMSGDCSGLFDVALDDIRIYNRALTSFESGIISERGMVTFKPVDRSGLAGHWQFNENTSTTAGDVSGNGNKGTISGAVWANGKLGKALSFDGVNDNVRMATSSALQITGNVTVAAWVKYTSLDASVDSNSIVGVGAVDNGDSANNYLYYLTLGSDKKLRLYWERDVGLDEEVFSSVSASVNAGEWHHYAVTRDVASNEVTFYVDGVQLGTVQSYTNDPNGGSNTALIVGGEIDAPDSNNFHGAIDDVRIYSRELSATEIQSVYGAKEVTINAPQNNKLTDGLIGLWSFNGKDISGTTAYDRSGQGNNGTLVNGPSAAIGKVGQALSFDGTNMYVELAIPTTSTTNVSVSVWVKWKSTSQAKQIFSVGDGATSGYGLIVSNGSCGSGNNVSLILNGSSCDILTQAYTLLTNEWTHLVITRGTSVWKLYANGVQVDTGSGDPSTPSSAMRIGASTASNGSFDGLIDEVRVYERELSSLEVQQLYNMSK